MMLPSGYELYMPHIKKFAVCEVYYGHLIAWLLPCLGIAHPLTKPGPAPRSPQC